MKGVGVFFNQMIDLSRFEQLQSKIDWIAPLMAPDQSSVQLNRKEWKTWRDKLPSVLFVPWIACEHYDDPNDAADVARWIVDNYPSDGIVYNCEKLYESSGKWRGSVLVKRVMLDTKLNRLPRILSMPSTPAERYDMDYRVFQRADFWFAPQAYWHDTTIRGDARPKPLHDSIFLPKQIHLGRDYRIQVFDNATKRWCRVVAWDGSEECIIRDMMSSRLYRFPVKVLQEGDYKYMVALSDRKFYDYKTGKIECGRLLGFQTRDKIVPTVGAYDSCPTTPQEIFIELDKISTLVGASLYLGDTSTSAHVEAVWQAING